jgi:2'-5' RNA ligase
VPTIRSFIAIQLSDQARSELTLLQDRLKELIPPNAVRWTAPKNIHLTLHFLGDLAVDHLEVVSSTIRNVAAAHNPFSLSLSTLGCFPDIRRPRIVWVGLSGETEPLRGVHGRLARELREEIGFQPESRPYSPHLTIGRSKKGVTNYQLRALGQALEPQIPRVGRLAALRVDRIHLIQSVLKPDGPVYTSLAHGKLGTAP